MFNISNSWILLLLPLPLLVRYLVPKAKIKGAAALKVPFFNTVTRLDNKTGTLLKTSTMALLLAWTVWALLVFAASGPRWLGKPVLLSQNGRNIMLAVDLSGSMRLPDMQIDDRYQNRLAVVKIAARHFIESRKGDRLGLILFGTRAYLQTPLTFDRQTVLHMLDDTTIGLAGTQTAIGDAMGLAIKRLEKASGKSNVLILLTDGGNNAGVVTPIDAAGVAAKLGIKIYTIGIGASRLVVPGMFGSQVIHPTSALDERTLKTIATMTHGLFFRAQSGVELEKVYKNINKLIPTASEKNTFRPIEPLFMWPLGMALLLSVLKVLSKLYKTRTLPMRLQEDGK